MDLARNLIGLSGHIPEKEIAIEFVGLRPGEKLEEELVGMGENAMPSSLEKILKVGSRTSVDGSFLLKVQEMADTDNLNDHDAVIKNLQHLIPTFATKEICEQNGSSGGLSQEVELVSGVTKRILLSR